MVDGISKEDELKALKQISTEDLNGLSLEEMLTKTYGKKGTKKRDAADKRIIAIARGLPEKNAKKETLEKSRKKKR